MSFGGQSTTSGMAFKSFETEGEVEERKKIRQEQWEKVRKPDDPLERPPDDDRSLFDKLQDQKDKKQQEYDDQFKFSNQVRGLDEEETHFLEEVSQKQMAIEKQRLSEEKSIIKEMRDANVAKIEEGKPAKDSEKPSSSKPTPQSSSRKSQQSLLMGAVKRKSSDSQIDSKKAKTDGKDNSTVSQSESRIDEEDSTATGPHDSDLGAANSEISGHQSSSGSGGGVAKVIGILPGIGNYSDDSSDSNSSNSSNDWDELLTSVKVKRIVVTANHAH